MQNQRYRSYEAFGIARGPRNRTKCHQFAFTRHLLEILDLNTCLVPEAKNWKGSILTHLIKPSIWVLANIIKNGDYVCCWPGGMHSATKSTASTKNASCFNEMRPPHVITSWGDCLPLFFQWPVRGIGLWNRALQGAR